MVQLYPILYSFRRCPYAMRARLTLYHAKIAHEHREVDLKSKPLELLSLSPKGTVPVLHLMDGSILEQSFDIMMWTLDHPCLSLENQNLITENDTTFKYALDRYKYPERYSMEVSMDYREQCEKFLKKIEKQLCPFLQGPTPTVVDMAIFPFIRQFSRVDPTWFQAQNYPQVHIWLNYFNTSDLFEDIMKKHEPWSTQDNPVLILF